MVKSGLMQSILDRTHSERTRTRRPIMAKKAKGKSKEKTKRKFIWRYAMVDRAKLAKKMREKGYEEVVPAETSNDGILIKCRRKVYIN